MRLFFIVLSFHIAVLAIVDSYAFNGRYRSTVWQAAGYQAQRVHAEVRYLLVKVGI